MFDALHEECGVFGIYSAKTTDVASAAYYALYALQHRGQESCGIAVNNDGIIANHADSGLVNEVFTKDVLAKLGEGKIAVGHVRYPTPQTTGRSYAQPLLVRHIKGPMVIAHNGNITNSNHLREQFELDGAIFRTTSDAELIANVITKERISAPSIEKAVEAAMTRLEGAYSLVIMSARKLIAVRDPHGLRPLALGKTADGSYVFASESCAFDILGAKFVRDILPGEIVVIEGGELTSNKTHCGGKCNMCVFEYVYFARPDSVIEGASVHMARQRAGEYLAKEHPVEADIVIGVPDSGLDAALGYARASGIPYGLGFIKNRYIGRTFIAPGQAVRENLVHIKLNPIKEAVAGKRVVMIDDSIVRGTTTENLVSLLREAGAKEVHMRISSPPFIAPCYFGTDVDSKDKLIACRMSTEEIRRKVGADTLGYLSLASVKKIAYGHEADFCVGCFTDEYPIEITDGAAPESDKFSRPVPSMDKKNK